MPKSQMEIPGTEAPKIKEIELAAESYVEARDKRMRLTEKEVTAKTNLIQTVLEHQKELPTNEKGERLYRYGDDMLVVLKPGKPGVKVKHWTEDEDENED